MRLAKLNPSASLVLGSGPEAHIRIPGLQPKHATVYPAQGSYWLQDLGTGVTIHGMRRLQDSVVLLESSDVVILGTTYVQFWSNTPPTPTPLAC